MNILVTGGSGFIGSCFIRTLSQNPENVILNVDKLTYASKKEALEGVQEAKNYKFIQGDIADIEFLRKVFREFSADFIVNFAAETHVDRSISNPIDFLKTNIIGTYNLLECSLHHFQSLNKQKQSVFRFLQISTDEVYGALGPVGKFNENSQYQPNSPYSASKAAGDHLVRAWHKTYNLPTYITNCSNNFGPYQDSEKFIPMIISNALSGRPISIYGNGKQIRDWLYVDDHIEGLIKTLYLGVPGSTYLLGGGNEFTNLEIARSVCDHLDTLVANKPKGIESFSELITYVEDRPGHDRRYAVDYSKIMNDLGWMPSNKFEDALQSTVRFFVDQFTQKGGV